MVKWNKMSKETKIKELEGSDFPDVYYTAYGDYGQYMRSSPMATGSNIEVLLDKINELVREVNRLKRKL